MAEVKASHDRPTLVLAILGALLMFASGTGKLAGAMTAALAAFGVPAWAVYAIGALEVAGAVGLLVPRLRFWAAAGFTALLLGALGTHLLNADWLGAPGPVVPGVLVALVAWRTRPTALLGLRLRTDNVHDAEVTA